MILILVYGTLNFNGVSKTANHRTSQHSDEISLRIRQILGSNLSPKTDYLLLYYIPPSFHENTVTAGLNLAQLYSISTWLFINQLVTAQ
jgi:hypothetical protein